MKRIKIFITLLLINFIPFTNTIFSQWTQLNGLYGGRFTALAANGTTFYAGSSAGCLFITTNNGTSWTQIGASQNFGNINSILLDGSSLYVGCYYGVFQTTDNGTSWNALTKGLSNNEVVSMVKGQNIFAATSRGGVFMLNSNTWTSKSNGLPSDGQMVSIVANGSTLFITTLASGVYTSSNNGDTWIAFKNGLPNSMGSGFFGLGVGKNYLFVGTSSGTYRTPLNNDSWTKVPNETNNGVIFSFAFYDKYIFAGGQLGGVLMSEDEGISWKDFNSGMPLYFKDGQQFPNVMNSAFSLAIGSDYLLAGTENGIYSLAALTTTWNSADVGLISGNVTSLKIDGQKVYAATSKGGFFISSDNGNSWYNFNTGLRGSPTVFATSGTNVYTYIGSQGPMILTTTEMRWINSESFNKNVTSFLIYNSQIYIGTVDGLYTADMSFKGITKISNALPTGNIQCLFSVGNILLAGTQYNGIYRSTDNGINWTPANSTVRGAIFCFAINNNEIYAGADVGTVLYSSDDGINWTTLVHTTQYNGLPPSGVNSLAVNGSYIYAAAGGDGVYISNNKGGSWHRANTGMPTNTVIKVLLINGDELWGGALNSIWHRPLSELTSVEHRKALPHEFALYQNYPNPFNPTTVIKYSIPKRDFVCLKIYDILGNEISRLINEEKPAGNYEIIFNASNLASGIYFYRIQSGTFSQSNKMIVLK